MGMMMFRSHDKSLFKLHKPAYLRQKVQQWLPEGFQIEIKIKLCSDFLPLVDMFTARAQIYSG